MSTDALVTSPQSTSNKAAGAPSSATIPPPDRPRAAVRSNVPTALRLVTKEPTLPLSSPGDATRQQPSVPFERAAPGRLVRVSGLHRWEGDVEDVGDRFFTASLLPVDHDGVPLEADFLLSDLSDDDRSRIAVGSRVYLTARTVVGVHGQRARTASIRVRRSSRWTTSEIEAIRSAAAEMGEALDELAD